MFFIQCMVTSCGHNWHCIRCICEIELGWLHVDSFLICRQCIDIEYYIKVCVSFNQASLILFSAYFGIDLKGSNKALKWCSVVPTWFLNNPRIATYILRTHRLWKKNVFSYSHGTSMCCSLAMIKLQLWTWWCVILMSNTVASDTS